MGRNDQNKGKKRAKSAHNHGPKLLRKQKKHTSGKKQKRYRTTVMAPESMAQGKDSNQKCQHDHAGFKPEIMDDIDPENGQSGKKKR